MKIALVVSFVTLMGGAFVADNIQDHRIMASALMMSGLFGIIFSGTALVADWLD